MRQRCHQNRSLTKRCENRRKVGRENRKNAPRLAPEVSAWEYISFFPLWRNPPTHTLVDIIIYVAMSSLVPPPPANTPPVPRATAPPLLGLGLYQAPTTVPPHPILRLIVVSLLPHPPSVIVLSSPTPHPGRLLIVVSIRGRD
jgi:hypothetical protein